MAADSRIRKVIDPAVAPSATSPVGPPPPFEERLATIDAIRGLALVTMPIYIPLAKALRDLPPTAVGDFFIYHLSHAPWHGFPYVDLGFPAFIITMAMSIVFSFAKRRHRGASRAQLFRGLAVRSALLFAFGFFFHGGFSAPLSDVRLTGVLPRLALCIFFAGVVELTLRVRWQIVLLSALLLGYWGLLAFVPVPGFGEGGYSPEGNLSTYVDNALLAGGFSIFHSEPLGDHVLNIPMSVATAVFGLLMGHVLASNRTHQARALMLLVMGVAAVNLGAVWDIWCPVNKTLWTSSYVLYSGGWCCLIGAAFHQLLEVWSIRSWAFPLLVVGRNPLVAYVAADLVPFDGYARLLVGDAFAPWLGAAHPFVIIAVQWLLWWLLLYWLYRRGIIVKI